MGNVFLISCPLVGCQWIKCRELNLDGLLIYRGLLLVLSCNIEIGNLPQGK